MRLEPANIICPKCGNGNYMRHLIGKGVGKLDMKCINCNSYFSFDELYKTKIAEVVKPKTNADRIRAMTDEELAKFIEFVSLGCDYMFPDCPAHDSCKLVCDQMYACRKGWLDWLKQEAKE